MVKNEWHYRINICAKSVIYMAFLAGVLSWLFNQNMIIQSFTISSKSIHQHSLSIIVGSWPSHYMYMLIISRKFDMCAVISIVIIINLLSSYLGVILLQLVRQFSGKYTSSLLRAVSPHWNPLRHIIKKTETKLNC